MAPRKNPARQRCLAYLRKHRSADAEELAKALGVSAADIRHHLSLLVRDSLVETVQAKPPSQRGRPRMVYQLSRISLGDNLPKLADALLGEWLASKTNNGEPDVLGKIADRLISNAGLDAQAPVSRRLPRCIEMLSSMHYQARWEAHATGPRVIFEFCPYFSIIDSHPELCKMDQLILEKSLGGHIEQIAKLEKGARNTPVCIFELLD